MMHSKKRHECNSVLSSIKSGLAIAISQRKNWQRTSPKSLRKSGAKSMSGESSLPRLTIDTNNVISGTISPGNYSSQLVDLHKAGAYRWIQTLRTFQELREVLQREKFIT